MIFNDKHVNTIQLLGNGSFNRIEWVTTYKVFFLKYIQEEDFMKKEVSVKL